MTLTLVPLHGIGSRQDLPLPFEYVLAGAALALVVSFVVLAFAWREPRWTEPPPGRPLTAALAADHPLARGLARVLVLLVWLAAGLGLWFGEDLVTNPALGFVYVWLWVGLVPLSLVAGPVWREVNPVRTLYAGLSLLPGVGGRVGRKVLPERVGLWPGAAALAGFLWLELVQPANSTLPVLQAWAAAWFVWVFAGALAWVRPGSPPPTRSRWCPAWSEGSRRGGGRVACCGWSTRCTTSRPDPHPRGTAAVVVVLLGGTAFDSFGASLGWVRMVQAADVSRELLGSLGLAGMIALVAFTFWIAVRQLGADAMAASVIPIVIGYTLGHYLSLLVLEGQRTAILLSDPLGVGWNLFGTAELGISMLWLENGTATALIQLAAIVGGHLLGVLVAHDVAIARLPRAHTVSGQVPLLLVMVGYTIGGLVLLFSP